MEFVVHSSVFTATFERTEKHDVAAKDAFLREANSYKRVLSLRNSWQLTYSCYTEQDFPLCGEKFVRGSPSPHTLSRVLQGRKCPMDD